MENTFHYELVSIKALNKYIDDTKPYLALKVDVENRKILKYLMIKFDVPEDDFEKLYNYYFNNPTTYNKYCSKSDRLVKKLKRNA